MDTSKGQLRRQFRRFVVPSVAAQWVFAFYTMVDGMFVSRGVSETALASVNIAMPFVNFIFAISLVLAVGTSTIVSIFLGQKNKKSADNIYSQNLVVVVATGILISVLVQLNLDGVASFLGAEAATLEYVKTYVGTIGYAVVFFMVGYYFEILIKADGRPKLATVIVSLGAVLNCILDYVFVFVVKWGVFGAAFATGLSQFAVSAFFLAYFLSSRAKLKLGRFKFSGKQVLRTFRLGLPSGITDFSAGIMIFLFNHAILKHLGAEAIVSYTIAAYINTIVVMSMTGIAQGMQPLVSFYHGRGQKADCDKLFRYAMVTAAVFAAVITVPTWLGAKGIVALFVSPDLAALRAYSVQVFRIFSLSFFVVGFNVVISGYFTAVEKEGSAMLISLSRGIVFISVCINALAAVFGGEGIWWAALLSESMCLVLSVLLLFGYRRKTANEILQER